MLFYRDEYAKVKRKAKRMYYSQEKDMLYELSKSSPRKFWKHFKNMKRRNKNVKDNVDINEFFEHFKNVSNKAQYSLRWGLKLNVKNTKICIFKKRKQNHGTEFFIENQKIDVMDNFTYLGINFKYNGSLADAVKALSEQALHAYYNLCYIFDKLQCNIKMKLSLFGKMIVPILLYGSEVWGIYGYKKIDKLH